MLLSKPLPAGSLHKQLKWIDAFETGDAEIDGFHRRLIRECNSLVLLIENDADWSLIVREFKQFLESCFEHFSMERSVLENARFPRCEKLVAGQRRWASEMQTILARMYQVDGSLPEHRAIPSSIGSALIDLIIRHDLDFRSHLLFEKGR
jgi:hemerythrin